MGIYFNIRFKASQCRESITRKKLDTQITFEEKIKLVRALGSELTFQRRLKQDCL